MKKTKLFGWTFVASMIGFFACTNNAEEVLTQESEIRLTSEITLSRAISDLQSTQIVEGQQVGVTIIGAKSRHNNIAWEVGEDGTLTNTGEAIYYGNGPATITAYHPYNDTWTETNQTFSVSTDQSTDTEYLKSDLLWATATSQKTKDVVPLVFTHKLAKINVTLISENSTDLSNATISICGTNIATEFNPIDGTLSASTDNIANIKAGTTTEAHTVSAIVVPQTVASGTKFIRVEHCGRTFYHTLSANKELKSGYSHNYTLTITGNEIIARSVEITNWEVDNNTGDVEEIETIPYNQIWYTSSDGNSITPNYTDSFGANLKSNVYENGKGVITFDYDVTSIGKHTFQNCSSLTSITMPNSVTNIGNNAFENCSSLTNITIPNSVTNIGNNAFTGSSLTNITIPNSIISIGNYVFTNCKSLTNITIPNSVTSIGNNAFSYCSSLTNITIPNSVTSIEQFAFAGCKLLTEIYVESTTPPTMGEDVFFQCNAELIIYVPKGCLEAYKNADYWKDLNLSESNQ